MKPAFRPRLHHTRALTLAALTMVLVGASACTRPDALECPAPQQGGNGVLELSPAQIRAASQTLSGTHDLGDGIDMIIAQLRKEHPKAGNAEIENYLMTVYCPVVAARAESKTAARQQMESFRDLVGDRLYDKTK